MKFNNNINYCILSDKIDHELLEKLNEYNIVTDITFENLKIRLENYLNKTICFNECFHKYTNEEKNQILNLLKLRNITFINVTSNIEEALLSDYMYVYHEQELVMEGPTKEILKEEKILKRIGFGLPFIVDLSIQLGHYNILDKTYYDIESLVNDLWQ